MLHHAASCVYEGKLSSLLREAACWRVKERDSDIGEDMVRFGVAGDEPERGDGGGDGEDGEEDDVEPVP